MDNQIELFKGLSVGETVYKTATLRRPSAGDMFAANKEAETLHLVPVAVDDKGKPVYEAQLIKSPTLVAKHLLRRQISIGPFNAPLEEATLDRLAPEDINLLQQHAEQLDEAMMRAFARGRADRDNATAATDA